MNGVSAIAASNSSSTDNAYNGAEVQGLAYASFCGCDMSDNGLYGIRTALSAATYLVTATFSGNTIVSFIPSSKPDHFDDAYNH